MKEVYIVCGTLDSENCPDYSVHGVFENYEDATQFMIDITVPALDKFEIAQDHRCCEYNDEGMLKCIFDDYDYRVIMHLEKHEIR